MTVSNFVAASFSNLAGTQCAITPPTALTPGSTLLAFIRMGSGATLTGVTDAANGAYTIDTGSPVPEGVAQDYWARFINNASSGTPVVTFTLSASGQSPRVAFIEIPNALTAASYDVSASNHAASGTAADGGTTATTGQANEEIIGFITAGANETFTAGAGYSIVGVEPAAGTSRLVIVHQTVSSIGTYSATATLSASTAWIGQTIAIKITGGAGATNVGRAGVRAANVTGKTVSSDSVGRIGPRSTSDASKTTSNTNIGRLGVRGTNTLGAPTSSSLGRAGVRGINDAGKSTFSFNVGGAGVRGVSTAGVTHAVDGVGRIGVRGVNTFTVAPFGGITNVGRVGSRSTSTSSSTHTFDNLGRVGVRSTSDSTRTITISTQLGRIGVRGLNVSGRQTVSSNVGRVGVRGLNTWIAGVLPTPVVPPTPNNSECEADWSLAAKVTWPDPSTLVGCTAPSGSVVL